MGFLGFFNFALTCFNVLAWPLFSLGYPLCASIRAIENNSNYHMRNMVTYWILYSLISLFELAFAKLIEWIPLWSCIKLGMICCLVFTQFEGAYYCYKSFIQPCLHVDLEEVMNKLCKRLKASVEKDNFLSVAERYITENGTEALEKLIASKLNQKDSRTDYGAEEIKAVAEAEKKEMHQIVKGSRTGFGVEEIKAVAEAEKNQMPQMVKSNADEFKVDHKDFNNMELPERKAPVPENSIKCTNPVLLQAEKKTIAALEVRDIKVQPAPSASTSEVFPAKATSEKVQKEWTCALCQVTTTCEVNLNSHIAGRKHRAKREELKSKSIKQTTKLKAGPFYQACKGAQEDQDSMKPASRDGATQDTIEKQTEKAEVKVKSVQDYSAVPYNYDLSRS